MAVLKDIASTLNISISTVSRALHNDHRISPDVREKVLYAASSIGYDKHILKRERISSSRIAGIIVPEVISEYYARLVHAATESFAQRNYATILRMTNFNEETMVQSIRDFKHMGVNCLIVLVDESEVLSNSVLDTVSEFHRPVFFITMNYLANFDYDSLFIDEQRGISMALEHLVQRGYKRIGFIGEHQTIGRCNAYRRIMDELKMPVDENHVCIIKERFEEGGYIAMSELLRRKSLPDAVFVSYDQMAIGAMQAVEHAGLTIPRDIALIGFDGILISKYIGPGLSTIQSPYKDMISIAVRILLNRVEGMDTAPQQIALKPTLIVREST